MVPKKSQKKQNVVNNKSNNYNNLLLSEILCPICRTILIEPVTLPCNHEFCFSCFDNTMANNNLVCPLCRIRIASWLRASRKEKRLVNTTLWESIQRLFPQQVKNKLDGIEECLEEEIPIRVSSKPGELRLEYEAQKAKEQEELRKKQNEEAKASEILIKKIQKDEELEKSILEEKLKSDELVAKQLSEEFHFDPGPSTSKIEKRIGPMDAFLKNVENNKLSLSVTRLKDVNCDKYKNKEFTTKILTLNKSASLMKKQFNSINLSKFSVLSETPHSENLYFKPIEQKKTPSYTTLKMVRVPAVPASPVSLEFRPPNGHIDFKHCSVSSPFVSLLICSVDSEKSLHQTKSPLKLNSNNKRKHAINSDEESLENYYRKEGISSNGRKTRSMTKAKTINEYFEFQPVKNKNTKKRKLSNSNDITSSELPKNDDFERTLSSPFYGFEKDCKFSLKPRNGIKNMKNFEEKTSKSENDTQNLSTETVFPHKNGNNEENNSSENGLNQISLENIELIIGAKCLRSDSNKKKLQEEEDLKLARKLHEELNCFKYPTRNNKSINSHVDKKFPTSRKQISLYKFLNK